MSKRNIIIIATLTVVLIIAAVAIIYTKADIENIYLISGKDPGTYEPKQNESYSFKNTGMDISIVIEVRYVTTKDEIKVQWEKIENDKNDIIQKNIIYPEMRGSGKIIVSLVKKNDKYTPGNYTATV